VAFNYPKIKERPDSNSNRAKRAKGIPNLPLSLTLSVAADVVPDAEIDFQRVILLKFKII